MDIAVFEARTLKDKRRVILSLKQRMRNRFNVSVAEVEHTDKAQRCGLGVAMIAQEARALHSQLDQVVEMVRRTGPLTLVDYHRELL